VYFAFDSDQLTHEAQAYLRKTAQAAAAAGQVIQITLTGHTDRAGPDDYNDNLSIRRAEAVFSFLENKLGSTVEYQLFARGETMPAVPTADGMREARNRRVEIALR
jgi:outer membrane protein OmpA-like peptidoglycan-associated protein